MWVASFPRSVDGQDQGAAAAVHRKTLLERDPDLRVRHLAVTAFAPQLADHFDHLKPRGVTAVAVGEQSAVGVGRHPAAQPGVALLDEVRALTDLAEAHLLEVADARDGEAVVD